MYNIELLEDSDIHSFQYHRPESPVAEHPIVERLGKLMVTHNYLLLNEGMKLLPFVPQKKDMSVSYNNCQTYFKGYNWDTLHRILALVKLQQKNFLPTIATEK